MSAPIDLYYWPTPNGWKIAILLEETGLAYRVIPTDITAGDQFDPEFLAISPNNKIPAIVDPDGPDGKPFALFESGAIMVYLAEKTGRFVPQNPRPRYETLAWLMFQLGDLGPMLGQTHHFRQYAPEQIDYAVDRYTHEAERLYTVLDRRLSDGEYIVGDYSIADIAIFPWTVSHEKQGQSLEDFPNLRRWFDLVNTRPAVQRGLDLLKDRRVSREMDDRTREVLFGARQRRQR